MTVDKSLKRRSGTSADRSVLNRAERIERLQAAEKWLDGQSPLGLPKVRVYKLSMKKKKKKKEEGEEDGAAKPAAAAAKPAAGGKPAAGAKPAAAAAKPAAGGKPGGGKK